MLYPVGTHISFTQKKEPAQEPEKEPVKQTWIFPAGTQVRFIEWLPSLKVHIITPA